MNDIIVLLLMGVIGLHNRMRRMDAEDAAAEKAKIIVVTRRGKYNA